MAQAYELLKAKVTTIVLARQSMGGRVTVREVCDRLACAEDLLLTLVEDTDQLTVAIGVRVPGAGFAEFAEVGEYILEAESYLEHSHIDALPSGGYIDLLVGMLVYGHRVNINTPYVEHVSGEFLETPLYSQDLALAMSLLEYITKLGGLLKIEVYYTARVGWCVWWRTPTGRYTGRALEFADFPLAVAKAVLKYASRKGLPLVHIDEQGRIDQCSLNVKGEPIDAKL